MAKYSLQTYCEVDGVRTMRDSRILGIFDRLVSQGDLRKVFYDGVIGNRETFLRSMKHGDNALYLVMAGELEVGVCWLNGWKQRTAQVHFCFFREAIKAKVDTVAIGRWMLRELLTIEGQNGEYLLDVLLGGTPANNRLALHYLKRCGWTVAGVVGDGCLLYWENDRRVDLVISSIRRRDLCE